MGRYEIIKGYFQFGVVDRFGKTIREGAFVVDDKAHLFGVSDTKEKTVIGFAMSERNAKVLSGCAAKTSNPEKMWDCYEKEKY